MGFIDPFGRFVIPPQFVSVNCFSDGRALVYENGTYRFIDKTGQPAFPGTFAQATLFAYGLAHVVPQNVPAGTYSWIDVTGKTVFTYSDR